MQAELNGIVVVDKPEGLSSARVVARIKGLFEARKAGHTGTLDPFATGVLICCLNRATRLSRFFLKGDKAYEAVLVLGKETDTQDATGTVTAEYPVNGIFEEQVIQTAVQFVGETTQVPPVYSALKHQGTPLYKLARKGAAVEKPARQVRIHRLEILQVRLPEVRFSVDCASGTYIRTLCADLGRELGCGGHLKTLRRTASCGFSVDDAVGLDRLDELNGQGQLTDAVIKMDDALHFMPAAVADNTLAKKIQYGTQLTERDFPYRPGVSGQGFFKVVDQTGQLIAVLGESTATASYNYCCVFSP